MSTSETVSLPCSVIVRRVLEFFLCIWCMLRLIGTMNLFSGPDGCAGGDSEPRIIICVDFACFAPLSKCLKEELPFGFFVAGLMIGCFLFSDVLCAYLAALLLLWRLSSAERGDGMTIMRLSNSI